MPQILTTTQAADVTVGQGNRYSKEQWTTYLRDVAAKKEYAGQTIGGCEADFPGVKTAHVRHMFKQILKAEPELAKKLTLGTSKDHGVCLKVAK